VPTLEAPARPNPIGGLYDFVRGHLIILNNVVLASATLVGALDFLAPRLSLAPMIVYSMTAGLALLMLLAAVAPGLVSRLMSAVGAAGGLGDSTPLWKRPAWQVAFAILLAVSIIGFSSVAKASQGGLIASQFPAARSLQESLLGLRRDVSDIKQGVDSANVKLDKLADAVDPAVAADRCADLACAVANGATPAAVRRLFAKGAQAPGTPALDAALLMSAALAPGPGRLEVIDLLAQKGIALDLPTQPVLTDPAKLTKQGRRAAAEVADAADLASDPAMRFMRLDYGDAGLGAWNKMAVCLGKTSGGVSLVELAGILGDSELSAHLRARGAKAPSRPLACAWRTPHASGYARVAFDQDGRYAGASPR
jgi:hypothetical protein